MRPTDDEVFVRNLDKARTMLQIAMLAIAKDDGTDARPAIRDADRLIAQIRCIRWRAAGPREPTQEYEVREPNGDG